MARRRCVRKHKRKETAAVLPKYKAADYTSENNRKDEIICVLALVTALLAGGIIGYCISKINKIDSI